MTVSLPDEQPAEAAVNDLQAACAAIEALRGRWDKLMRGAGLRLLKQVAC